MDNFSIVKTKKGKEVLVYNENLYNHNAEYRVFNMRKNSVVCQVDYLGRLLNEDQEARWVEISNDCDTKYAFKGKTKFELKNGLIIVLYAWIENDRPTLEKYQRAKRRMDHSRKRKHDARKTHPRKSAHVNKDK